MNKFDRKIKRKKRIRKTISGSAQKPRINVYRSNKYVYIQAIDDNAAVILAGVSDKAVKKKLNKSDKAKEAGKIMGEKLKSMKVTQGVFDRAGNAYHGRIKSVAEGLREAGLNI